MKKIVIIGNGIAGVTAARHIRKKSNSEILIISSESEHFFSRTALMYAFMGHMRLEDLKPYEDWFWKKNKIDLLFDRVDSLDFQTKTLNCNSGKSLNYDELILAVGSKPNKFGWPGQDLKGVQGLYSMQDLEMLEKEAPNIKNAVIVGGGLIGVELAEMLNSRGIKVTFLVRESKFWGNVLPPQEAEMISNHMIEHHIDLRFNEELAEVVDDGSGRVKAIKTKSGEIIACQFVGLTAGVSPNVDWLNNSELEVDRGVLVDEFLKTNQKDVYAIGDCAQMRNPLPGRASVEQVWYTGRIMGETLAETICGTPTKYNPGPWFNSAKFFDIEYQTYGNVKAVRAEHESDFYWEDESKKIAMHFVWNKENKEFIGINSFGIRLRHDLFDQWLKAKVNIQTIMAELKTANFDPEFYRQYEHKIVAEFNRQTGLNIEVKNKQWWRKLLKA